MSFYSAVFGKRNNLRKLFCLFLVFYLVGFESVVFSWAQISPDTLNSVIENNSGYILAPGVESQLLMKVNVWGEVNRPGVYEVLDRTDLVSLISTAGGPTDGAKLSKVKLVRNYGQHKQVMNINLKKYMEDGRLNTVPQILPGDTVVIPKNKFSSVAKYMTFFYSLAVIAAAVKIYVD